MSNILHLKRKRLIHLFKVVQECQAHGAACGCYHLLSLFVRRIWLRLTWMVKMRRA